VSAAFISVTLSEAGAEDPLASPERRAEAAGDAQRMIDVFTEETGWRPERRIEVICFAGEEPRFGTGCVGSRAAAAAMRGDNPGAINGTPARKLRRSLLNPSSTMLSGSATVANPSGRSDESGTTATRSPLTLAKLRPCWRACLSADGGIDTGVPERFLVEAIGRPSMSVT
jgi:hypothetical protein